MEFKRILHPQNKISVTAVPTHPEGSFIHGSLSSKELIIKPLVGGTLKGPLVAEDRYRPGVREFVGCIAEMPVSVPGNPEPVLVRVSEVLEVVPYHSVKLT